jgi:hypothetical protein
MPILKNLFLAMGFCVLVWSIGCSNEITLGAGSQMSGQLCFVDGDCVSGLKCKDRSCVPVTYQRDGQPASGPGSDAGLDSELADDTGADDASPPGDAGPGPGPGPEDAGPAPDGGSDAGGPQPDVSPASCPDEPAICLDSQRLQQCRVTPSGRVRWDVTTCEADQVCRNGACRPTEQPSCCAGGCPDDQFCYQCTCTAYQSDICRYQDQPCHREGAISNGFLCTQLAGTGDRRCYGICDRTSSRPDQTCPDTNTICAIGDDNGLCASTCNTQADCGEPNMGCIFYDNERASGICVPTNDNNLAGSVCNTARFFDCEAGHACVNLGGGGQRGSCTQMCRPFVHEAGQSDCDEGFCLAFTPRWGVCAPSNDFFDGQRCEPAWTTCSEDAVGCYPRGFSTNQCIRTCRLAQGNGDCISGQRCLPFDASNPDLGICI